VAEQDEELGAASKDELPGTMGSVSILYAPRYRGAIEQDVRVENELLSAQLHASSLSAAESSSSLSSPGHVPKAHRASSPLQRHTTRPPPVEPEPRAVTRRWVQPHP
jgi:hypothetical protein